MRKAIAIFLGFFCLIGSCANNDTETSTKAEQKKETGKKAVTKDNAAKLAEVHLALKNWSWGKPENVEEHEEKVYLSYNTPERERRLIGSRMLVVDKNTGVVSTVKRR